MKKEKKRVFWKILVFLGVCIGVMLFSLFMYFFVITNDAKLNLESLALSPECNLTLIDADNNEIDTSAYFSSSVAKLEDLPKYVPQAFIATEDKRFYSHKGVDYKRMVGAIIKNIKSGSFSEGASTISQQLIKNTHLSHEKTLNRKLKEIKLAKALEKKFDKDEILEMYLNNIYFGNGCYGIEKASSFYFGKSASELSLGESALLASVINAPSYYDPITKNEKAEKRKKLVLKNMLKEGYISNEDYEKNANLPENIVKNASKPCFGEIKAVLTEAAVALNVNQNQVKNMKIIIHTSLNKRSSELAQNAIDFIKKQNLSVDAGVIVLNNETKSVVALSSLGNVNLMSLRRQPGSAIKPIIVYSPALEEGLLYPDSILIDEPINIGGYQPSNANKTYMGKVTVRKAVEKSLNIPAVKTMSNLSVKVAKEYGEKFGLQFDKADQNLALALGGMTKGVTLKELADAYSTLATEGQYCKSSLINYIENKDGTILYRQNKSRSNAVSNETAYLMTDILKGATKNGTSKRLSSLPYPIASKTGTVGVKGSKNNTDAYCVAYTPNHTVIAWIGSNEQAMQSNINGSNYPTEMVKKVLSGLYDGEVRDFERPAGVNYYDIDTRSLNENRFELADDFAPVSYKKSVLLSDKHLPPKAKTKQTILNFDFVLGEPVLSFYAENHASYKIYRKDERGNQKLLNETIGAGSDYSFIDHSAKKNQIYEYCVTSKMSVAQEEMVSNKITILTM